MKSWQSRQNFLLHVSLSVKEIFVELKWDKDFENQRASRTYFFIMTWHSHKHLFSCTEHWKAEIKCYSEISL